MADRDFALEVDMRESVGHHDRGLHSLARRQVQQVDIRQRGFMCQVAGDENGQSLGMLRTRRAVCGQAFQALVFLDKFGLARHDFGGFAVQRQRDLAGQLRHPLARHLDVAHDELEMRTKCA